MRNVSDRSCRENQNTHSTFKGFFKKKKKNSALYKIKWENTVQPDRSQMAIKRMRTAHVSLQIHTKNM